MVRRRLNKQQKVRHVPWADAEARRDEPSRASFIVLMFSAQYCNTFSYFTAGKVLRNQSHRLIARKVMSRKARWHTPTLPPRRSRSKGVANDGEHGGSITLAYVHFFFGFNFSLHCNLLGFICKPGETGINFFLFDPIDAPSPILKSHFPRCKR